MNRAEIIEQLKVKGIPFNPTAKVPELEALLKGEETPKTIEAEKPNDMSKLMEMMGTVITKVSSLDDRLKKVEGPDANAFKAEAKQADIESATAKKQNVDEKLVKIVEEVLGVDFGVELESFPDRPGFLFTVIVPQRLSDVGMSTRPSKDPVTGEYKKDHEGKYILEEYYPEDRRSRAIGNTQSYDAIRDHCIKVRSYLVAYYQKMSKPLPEFKIKA